MHARSGGNIEVMGLMQGYVTSNTFIVTDAFRLPVEGTETRVNAQEDGYEYMVNYLQSSRDGGSRPENAVGWYHSHPGYGCWLSGIDVATQSSQQTYQDPFAAVVIDPDRTISAGKVEIGAFRTYPKDYKPPGSTSNIPGMGSTDEEGYQSIPLTKVEDFGAHASQYYSLEVSHFKSTLDTSLLSLLWNKYWVATLGQSPLLTNREYTTKQISDLAEKAKGASRSLKISPQRPQLLTTSSSTPPPPVTPTTEAATTTATNPSSTTSTISTLKVAKNASLSLLVKNASKIESEELAGLMAEEVKQKLFWGVVQDANSNPNPSATTNTETNGTQARDEDLVTT